MWIINNKSYTDEEAISCGILTSLQIQVYNALKIAAERMGQFGKDSYYKKHKLTGGFSLSYGKLHFTPTQEHKDVVDAMPKVLSGAMSPEEGMALLHQYDVFQQRF